VTATGQNAIGAAISHTPLEVPSQVGAGPAACVFTDGIEAMRVKRCLLLAALSERQELRNNPHRFRFGALSVAESTFSDGRGFLMGIKISLLRIISGTATLVEFGLPKESAIHSSRIHRYACYDI
jgi:hypothetical protein